MCPVGLKGYLMNDFYDQLSDNPENCFKGSEIAYENSKRLLNCANLLGEKEFYGPASTLAILGAEEAIKSYALLSSLFPIERQELLSKYFRFHHKKHNAIKSLQLDLAPGDFLITLITDWVQKSKNIPPNDRLDRFAEILPKFQKLVEAQMTDPESKTKIESEWWKQANRTKNDGLYVDYIDGKWKSPSQITSEHFAKALTFTRSLVEHLNQYHSIPFEIYMKLITAITEEMKED